MFTGIIQDVGRVVDIVREDEQAHMRVQSALDMRLWREGDSVAVDGCCLTVTQFPSPGCFAATLSAETLRLTCFADAQVGQAVNLEPALRMGDALGGHWVTGHVDDRARVLARTPCGEHVCLRFAVPQTLAPYLVRKGSVAINGVSLTVNEVAGESFVVNLIPHTLRHTNLGLLDVGDWVNIETDILGRYVERMMQFREQS
ncbi:MAG: riboflavin synthase [Zetaproteobacteria bacterium]|nr:MAG: riboflavin synthase [Zetaproteobacteria bacterium]